ncbi:MAG: tRNA (adenosine(37)-N6)-threonylcarbamoyltransferase complex ATPase subunit type 1 TsaE [Syntrophus sp. RIFOXYC2_FULL_54_9]|nr:MAG: tRNA (adenosine(37)-N6)-threonylcarbamoyltransferase complex ATPase subunit type 1 TsaE [Syntrophus sp. GWC2_56_31]OHE31803.1 MAG: tRNA (adenosine(37)-N6)-threonylcarbamoyltransferase complex ATPase subunit type 1 TsaE [Syntrophus sp. RIFOXYC2_FULL_54_9]HBB18429.1 tRNA (adenosine(37)-N6)-threonylcarbamoyltransferase complex ATPase subunit type 1 TsaE [Syntrophus sp. (in: bacteria)]
MAAQRTSLVLISKSPMETLQIGRRLGAGLKGGECVALAGELGAGKTCLTQGIANGLGVPDGYVVASPTFTLINEYPGKETALFHLDIYRLTGPGDLEEIGYREYLTRGGVVVVEWADKISDSIPEEAMWVTFSYLDENVRKIEISDAADRIYSWKQIFTPKGG